MYILFKLIAEQTICIHSRGNCTILPPNLYENPNTCENFFELPDYPTVEDPSDMCTTIG